MNIGNIKAIFLKIINAVLTTVKRFYNGSKKWIDKLFARLPIQNKYKRILSMTTLSLLLVVVIIVAVPTVKNVGESVGEAVGNAVDNLTGSKNVQTSSKSDVTTSMPEPINILPDQMETPQNDTVSIPTGGASWRFSDDEVYRLQRLMVYLERCENFDYDSENKDASMALTAFRYLINTGSLDLTVSQSQTQYYTSASVINKSISNFFGRKLSSQENLGSILYTGGSYTYTEPNPGPTAITGYITQAYSLGNNYYKITGIVTRGLANESGRYSRKLNIILLKDSSALYGYYVVSLINETIDYTYIDTLPDFNLDSGYNDENGNEQTTASTPADTTTTSDTTVSENSSISNSVSSEESSSAPVSTTSKEVVALPEADSAKKSKLSSADEQNVQALLTAMPNLILNFDSAHPSNESDLTLLAHLMLCADQNIDFTTQTTSHTYKEVNDKAKVIFGTVLPSVTTQKETEKYTLDPYIISGKMEYKLKETYDLGNNQYLILCDVDYFSNPLLSEADISYQYTAVVEKSESALYKFFLKSQTFVKQ